MSRDRWYKDAVFYQIWPRSFCDGNGDGIGDLWGVLEKLDYIASLGVTGIWFSPLYPSPQADFGYDIADYCAINPEYGDLEVFRQVLDGAHERGLRVIMDLVVNHTSSEHPWFKASRSSKDSPYHDYYIWRAGGRDRKGRPTPPNNWDSLFEGRAWEYELKPDEWYLHVFAKGQPDLNMDNPAVREEVEKVMRFWLDMGVDGFREDVITFTSKAPGLPNDRLMVPGARGLRFYENGPRVHEFLAQFRDNVLSHYDCMTVGEAPMITPAKALPFIEEGPNQTLDLMFHFEHMGADCLFTDYVPRPFSLRSLKRAFGRWQKELDGRAWNALYIENHDHPRIVSRYGSEAFREKSAMMLACSYLFQKGTPFIYQGQEIGMTNTTFSHIEDVPDVSAKNQYRRRMEAGDTPARAMALINRAARDHARTPMQWSGAPHAGFCPEDAEPWFAENPNYPEINVERDEADPYSVLNFYRKAIALRRRLPVVREGIYREHKRASGELYVYEREMEGQRLLVVCSFADHDTLFSVPGDLDLDEAVIELSNYEAEGVRGPADGLLSFRPYECCVWRLGGDLTQGRLDELLAAQQGEADAVPMYQALADAVEAARPQDAATFRRLAADEARHEETFRAITSRLMKPSTALAKAMPVLLRTLGPERLYKTIAQREYGAAKRYEALLGDFPQLLDVSKDEARHGDAILALLKGLHSA